MKHGRQVGGPSNGLQQPRQPFSPEQPPPTLIVIISAAVFAIVVFADFVVVVGIAALVAVLAFIAVVVVSVVACDLYIFLEPTSCSLFYYQTTGQGRRLWGR